MKKLLLCVLLSSALAGCGNTVYGPNRLVNNVKIEPVGRLNCGTGYEPDKNIDFQTDFFVKACKAYGTPGDRGKARLMLESGITLNWMRCSDFFRQRAANQTRQRIVRRSVVPISALITGVLGVIDFSSVEGQQEALQILGLAQTATLAGLEIYESEFLFGAANVNSVRKLTMRDLDAHARIILSQDDLGFYRVTRHLIDHQLRCTPANILELTQAAIDKGNVEPSNPVEILSATEKQDIAVRNSVSRIYNTSLSTEQVAMLWWLINHGVDNANEMEIIKERLGGIETDIFSPSTPLTFPLSASSINIAQSIKDKVSDLPDETGTRFGIVRKRIQNAIQSVEDTTAAKKLSESIKFTFVSESKNHGAVETRVSE